ncbi:MAG TPA: hypothetical protein VMT16_07345, partial [Thermoanaerobaculia bacterium]|nr:hypothetical protein [Thermoanaerobaculia bacterium]
MRAGAALILVALLLVALPAQPDTAMPGSGDAAAYRVELPAPGVYRLDGGDLEALLGAASSELAATFAGVPVPLWVEDGGDGRFDRRDWLELAWHRDPSASLPLPGKPAA